MARYFAYGSNMSARQMADRCPGARALGPARLRDHRLVFDRYSAARGGFVADFRPEPGAETWGVLWEVTRAHLAALDRAEGVARGAYRRATVRVDCAGRDVEAVAYVVVAPGDEGVPNSDYLGLLLEGAREHGLPAAYVAELERFGAPPRSR